MATLYGAQLIQTPTVNQVLRYDTIGKNSEVFTTNDPVSITSGVMLVATATSIVGGVAGETQTMSSTNQTVAQVYEAYVPINENDIYLMGTNSDLTNNATDGRTYYKLTGTTGAVQVDVTSGVQSGTSRIVEIVKVDPRGIGGSGAASGLREVYVRFVSNPAFLQQTA